MSARVLGLVALLPSAALAVEDPADPPVIYAPHTVIDIEDGLALDGQLVRPSGVVVVERPGQRFNPLIWRRADFRPELRASVDQVK